MCNSPKAKCASVAKETSNAWCRCPRKSLKYSETICAWNAPALFVSLKGRQRGQPLTAAGLRSLFRHHRVRSQVRHANPHRFRHSFGRDMVQAGMSLPALQKLMGHAQISTTMLYVELAPQDVWREYARAIEKRKKLGSEHLS